MVNGKKNLIISLLVILLLYKLPLVLALFANTPGFVSTGHLSIFDPWDTNVYISNIIWSQKFGFSTPNTFTTLPSTPSMFYPLYSAAGSIFIFVNPHLLYELLSVASLMIFVFVCWKIGQQILNKTKHLLPIIVSTAGGISLASLTLIKGPDVYNSIFPSFGSLNKPHETLALTAQVLAIYWLILLAQKRSKSVLPHIVFSCIFILFYPHMTIVLVAISLFASLHLYILGRKKTLVKLLAALGLIVLFAIIRSFALLRSEGYSGTLLQVVLTPNPIDLVLAFLPLIVFSFLGLTSIRGSIAKLYFAVWVLTQLTMAYVPVTFQRLYLRGLFVPIVILALLFIEDLFIKQKKEMARLSLTVVVVGGILSSLTISILLYNIVKYRSEWYFMPIQTKKSFEFINNKLYGANFITDNYIVSSHLAANAAVKVYLGHAIQSLGTKEKNDNREKFYNQQFTVDKAVTFLCQNNIDYVYVSEDESLTNYETVLDPVYSEDSITIFQFTKSGCIQRS